MAIELTEESTHEDIQDAVDQIIADRTEEPEETTEETSDAEIVADGKAVGERDTSEDTVEKGTMSPSDETTGDTEKPAKKEKSSDWRTDEVVSEAAAYGVDKEELADFGSREELDRALKLLDRNLDTERQKLAGDDAEGKEGETQTKDKGETSEPEDGRYDIRLDKDTYDDELVDEFTRMRDHYESRIAALEERFSTAEAYATEQEFDRSVDELGLSKLFGKTGEESEAELAKRKELYEHVKIEQVVMQKLGRTVGHAALVQRVARSIFPEEFDKKLLKNHTRKISRQSNGRQGGGATRPTDPPETVRDEMRRLYKELDQAG